MTDNSHPEKCQCGEPGWTGTTNLGASHIAPESIDLEPCLAREVEWVADVCRKAAEDGRHYNDGPPDSRFLKVFINSPGEHPPHESLWAYQLSPDTAQLLNRPFTWRYEYGEVVRLGELECHDKQPLVIGGVCS